MMPFSLDSRTFLPTHFPVRDEKVLLFYRFLLTYSKHKLQKGKDGRDTKNSFLTSTIFLKQVASDDPSLMSFPKRCDQNLILRAIRKGFTRGRWIENKKQGRNEMERDKGKRQ